MADIISAKLGNPAKKAKTIEEYQKEEAEKAVKDPHFKDWVPIDDNISDFDLNSILNQIENENEKYGNPPAPKEPSQGAVALQSNQQIEMPKENVVAVASPPQPVVPSPPMPEPQPCSSNQVVNVSNAQNYPVLPKMFFPNSNVTINYNFNGPKP